MNLWWWMLMVVVLGIFVVALRTLRVHRQKERQVETLSMDAWWKFAAPPQAAVEPAPAAPAVARPAIVVDPLSTRFGQVAEVIRDDWLGKGGVRVEYDNGETAVLSDGLMTVEPAVPAVITPHKIDAAALAALQRLLHAKREDLIHLRNIADNPALERIDRLQARTEFLAIIRSETGGG